jgi:adenine phosphoribosyltransferase
MLAQELNGFYTCSKALTNCLETISATYDLEYGTDTLEIHADAIQKPNPYT